MSDRRSTQRIDLAKASHFSIGDITNVANPVRASGALAAPAPAPAVCRVLLLGANPADTSRLRLDREARAIEDALQAAIPGGRQRFELLQGWASSALDVQQDLFRHRPDLVHYSGHGAAGGELLLEARGFRDLLRRDAAAPGPPPGGALAPAAAMARLLAHAPAPVRCVVFNACHSASLAEIMADHVDCAIGMQAAVRDDCAVVFAWGFYHALAQGQSVATSFSLAAAQLELVSPEQRGCPRLFAARCDPAAIAWNPSP